MIKGVTQIPVKQEESNKANGKLSTAKNTSNRK